MTRECKSDFTALRTYIDQYRISKNLGDNTYIESLKSMHKCYFSLITWNAEMEYRKDVFMLQYGNCTDEICYRLSETASDMGASIFNWINGSYKTSRVMLRVAIENFVRAVSAIDDKSQLVEKNVFSLFEKAESLPILNSKISVKNAYNQLRSDYKLLCEDTHTTTVNNMEQLSTLANLPVFKRKKAENTKDVYLRVAQNTNLILCMSFNEFYHAMHHRNKENILHSLKGSLKPLIIGT